MYMRDRSRWRRIAAGFVAAALAIVLQYVVHRLNRDILFPPFALADWAIRVTPGELATEAIERLGHFARLGLAASMVVAVLVAGAAAGLVRTWAVVVVVVGFALIAAWLAPIAPGIRETFLAAAAGGAMAGLAATVFVDAPLAARRESASRRRLLLAGTAGAVVLMTGVSIGTRRSYRAAEPPSPASRLVIAPDPAFEATTGISPLITSNADHYTVDININRPRQDASAWRLDVSGLVATPRKLAYVELAALPVQERAIYLQCISNVANGDLMGNALWTVATLRKVLELAGGPLDGADTVVARAVDGYHESYPVTETGSIYVALAMGGEAIPNDHGSPMRLLYAGHYGMRSIKWVTGLEVIRGEEPGYWQSRAWDELAPLRIGARIDTPAGGEQESGRIVAAGVAWGPEPVTKVECSTDGGSTWQAAQLEPAVDELAWQRWRIELELPAGEYGLVARAHTANGSQDDVRTPPHPSGANAYHRKTIIVRG